MPLRSECPRRCPCADAFRVETTHPRYGRSDNDQGVQGLLFRGNIVELAVAFVMGLAFAAVVNSLVNNLVMPIIAAIIGKPNFRDLTFTIHESVFRYGAFLTDLPVHRDRRCRLLLHCEAGADDAYTERQAAR